MDRMDAGERGKRGEKTKRARCMAHSIDDNDRSRFGFACGIERDQHDDDELGDAYRVLDEREVAIGRIDGREEDLCKRR